MKYNKLVRDKIPKIIKKSGKKPIYYILSDDEYHQALIEKLIEELNEFLGAKTKEEMIEELADIEEVLDAIKRFNGICMKVLIKQITKSWKKGEFDSKVFLVEVEE